MNHYSNLNIGVVIGGRSGRPGSGNSSRPGSPGGGPDPAELLPNFTMGTGGSTPVQGIAPGQATDVTSVTPGSITAQPDFPDPPVVNNGESSGAIQTLAGGVSDAGGGVVTINDSPGSFSLLDSVFIEGASILVAQLYGENYEAGQLSPKQEAAFEVSRKAREATLTDPENVEYGGLIYRNRDGTYGATTDLIRGSKDCERGAFGCVDVFDALPQVPTGADVVGFYHSHPTNDLLEGFGPFSLDDIRTTDRRENPHLELFDINAYVVHPNGNVFEYDASTNTNTPLGRIQD